MDEKKVQEIFSDEAFVTSLLALDTAEEVQTAVKAKGLDLSISDIEWIKARLNSGKMDELSAEGLESVAGGFNVAASEYTARLIVGVMGIALGGAIVGLDYCATFSKSHW